MKFVPAQKRVLRSAANGHLSKVEAARKLGVSRKTVYKWLRVYDKPNAVNKRVSAVNPRLEKEIIKVISAHPDWGARRISIVLRTLGISVSGKSVWKVLKQN